MSKTHKRGVFLRELDKSRGKIYAACNATGIAPVTFYRWCEKYPDFAERVNDVKNSITEYVEGKLFENIDKGSVPAQLGFLKAKHPDYRAPAEGNVRLIQNNIQVKVNNLGNEQIDNFIAKRYGIGKQIIMEQPRRAEPSSA